LGKISEGSGEDAYLGSQIAKAMVRGINKMICQKIIRFYPA
jgi:beta-glucosidase-like glycosyl hydrolase